MPVRLLYTAAAGFESAHRLPNVPAGHQCGRIHGHRFEVILHANLDLGARDIGVDYDHIDECWAPIHALLDHACLNDIPGLENPTSELLAGWTWERLKPTIPELSWVTMYETANSGAAIAATRSDRPLPDTRLRSHLFLGRRGDGTADLNHGL